MDQANTRPTEISVAVRSPALAKETFQIFAAVDLYATLQDLTQMKPVATNPKLTFEQLFGELATGTVEEQRALVRDQVLCDRLRQGSPADAAAHARKVGNIGRVLDWNPDGSGPVLIPISHHNDSMHAVTTGYGAYEKPEDFVWCGCSRFPGVSRPMAGAASGAVILSRSFGEPMLGSAVRDVEAARLGREGNPATSQFSTFSMAMRRSRARARILVRKCRRPNRRHMHDHYEAKAGI